MASYEKDKLEVHEEYIPFGNFLEIENKNVHIPEYDLILCKLTEEPIAELNGNIYNLEVERSIGGIDQIRFTVPKKIENNQGEMRPNPVFDLVEGNRLLFVDSSQYFILSKPKIISVAGEGVIKEITGFSREYELTQRILNQYEGVSRMLYDFSNTIDENGLELGFLNYVENHTSWSVGYINKDVNKKYRMLKFNSTNIYKSFEDVQKSFSCVFQFDTIKKEINVYETKQLGVNQGIYLSDENFINELNQELEDENIVTRLYLYGNDNISIQPLTITGQPYIEDYSFFRTEEYMSKELLNGLKAYDNIVDSFQGKFEQLVEDKNKQDSILVKQRIDKRELEKDLTLLEHEWDLLVSEDKDYDEIRKLINKKEKEIKDKENEIKNTENKIDEIYKEIKNIKDKTNIFNFLTPKLVDEMDYFIKEEKYYDSNYTEENREDLLAEGKKVLEKISKPKLTFDIEVEDFLQMAEARYLWGRFRLGDIINIEHKKIGFNYEVRLLKYVHAPEEKSLRLTFSSTESIYDDAIYLEQILEESVNTSNSVDFNKYKWDKGEDVSNAFSDYINNSLDLSNQALLKEKGQRPILDSRGLWLYKENPDGTVSPEQVRAINNMIAITKDNWETIEWALTPNGINAKQLIGDIILGTDLQIISDSGVVQILNNVINIRDDQGRVRVSLGNYKDGKYGLQLKDKEGRQTVLDEDGMLQTWQEGRTDNVDENNGLELNVFIPKNTRHIFNAVLRIKRELFRAYSKTADSETIRLDTTKGGGINMSTTASETFDSETTSNETQRIDTGVKYEEIDATTTQAKDDERYGGQHNHGISYGTQLLKAGGGSVTWVPSGAHAHGKHKHPIELPPHEHRFRVPSHTHPLYAKEHKHEIDMPSHNHPITPVIYKSGYKPSVKIYVNGDNITYKEVGTTWLGYDRDNIKIGDHLKIGQWNTINIVPDRNGRIDATVFIQCMLNFEGLE